MHPSWLLLSKSFSYTDGILLFFVVVLILLSAFFSSSETAFSSVNVIHIRSYAEEKKKGARRALYICDHFDMTLSCLLVGNNLVNIANTTICAYLFSKFILNPTLANVLNTAIMTILLLIFGEIIPKSYAKHNPEKFALKFSGAVYFAIKILIPLYFLFYLLQKHSVKQQEEVKITEDEFETMIDTMQDQGVIDSDNASIIHGAIDLSEKTVYDIMVPRVDIEALPITASADEIKKLFIETQFSRIPIYIDDKDNIVGILNYKDFTIAEFKSQDIVIKKIIKDPLKVTETMKVDELIKTMQVEKKHMAVVVDEYGGTSGIVTMEDALELMVGEIYDEHDDKKENPIKKVSDNEFLIDPDVSIEDLFEYLEIEHLPDSQYSSVGGMVYELMESVPRVGSEVNITAADDILDEHNNYITVIAELKFIVEKVDDNRIKQLRLFVGKRSEETANEEN